MFCELCNYDVECEQIMVAVGDNLKKHFAILLSQVEKGIKKIICLLKMRLAKQIILSSIE